MCGVGGLGAPGGPQTQAQVAALGQQLQQGLAQLQGGGGQGTGPVPVGGGLFLNPAQPNGPDLPPGVSRLPAPPQAMKPVAAPAGAPTTDAKGGKLHYFNHAGDPTPRAYDQATVNFWFLAGNTNQVPGPGALNSQLADGLAQLQAMGINVNGGGGPGGKPGQGPTQTGPGFDAFQGGCMGGVNVVARPGLPALPESMKRYDAHGVLIIPPGFGPPAPPSPAAAH